MVWRRALIWSVRVVSGTKFSRAKAAWFRNTTGSGSGALRREKTAPPPACPASFLPRCAPFLQLVAEGHEFIDLGNDTVLFGEGGEGEGRDCCVFRPQSWHFRSLTKSRDIVDEVGSPQS